MADANIEYLAAIASITLDDLLAPGVETDLKVSQIERALDKVDACRIQEAAKSNPFKALNITN